MGRVVVGNCMRNTTTVVADAVTCAGLLGGGQLATHPSNRTINIIGYVSKHTQQIDCSTWTIVVGNDVISMEKV